MFQRMTPPLFGGGVNADPAKRLGHDWAAKERKHLARMGAHFRRQRSISSVGGQRKHLGNHEVLHGPVERLVQGCNQRRNHRFNSSRLARKRLGIHALTREGVGAC